MLTIRIQQEKTVREVIEIRSASEVKGFQTTAHRLIIHVPSWESLESKDLLRVLLGHFKHIENVYVHQISRFGSTIFKSFLQSNCTMSKLTIAGTVLADCSQVYQLIKKCGISHLVLATERTSLKGISLEGLQAFQLKCEACDELSQFSSMPKSTTLEFFHLKLGASINEHHHIMNVSNFLAQRLPQLKKLKLTGNTRFLLPLVDASETIESLEINWNHPSDLIEVVNLLHNILPRLKRLRLANECTDLVSILPSVLPRAPDGGLQILEVYTKNSSPKPAAWTQLDAVLSSWFRLEKLDIQTRCKSPFSKVTKTPFLFARKYKFELV